MAGPLVKAIIRQQLAARLREETGIGYLEARRRVRDQLDDATIDEVVGSMAVAEPPREQRLYGGWLADNWETILAIIMKLLPLLLLFLGDDDQPAPA